MKLICFGLLAAFSASAQQYAVSTVAGRALPPTPAPALSSSIGNTNSVARDAAGDIYFSSDECVFKVDTNGILTLVAGNSTSGYSGDGGPAINAQLSNPWGVAVDQAGNVYIADELNNRIRRVSPAGIITTVAGVGTIGFSGDGGSATDAQLHFPLNVTVDASGNLYIADYFNNRVRKVSPNGIIVTVGGGGSVYPGDGGLAIAAAIAGPAGMAVDASGNIFVADRGGMRVREISTGGIISTVAGNGTAGYSGDGGLATAAEMYLPSDVAVDAAGNLYIADFNNNQIRKVAGGIISSLPASAALNGPSGVALDAGNLYIADRFNNVIRKLSTGGLLTNVAGNGSPHFSGDGGAATSALLNNVTGVAVDAFGNLFIADSQNSRVREVSTTGTITTVAGGGTSEGDGAQATSARLVTPVAVAFDTAGNLYIADSGDQRIRKVTPGGIISTVAGNGTPGVSGDGGLATAAQIYSPSGVAVDGSGNIYIVSGYGFGGGLSTVVGNSVREVTPNGTITTLIPSATLNLGVLSMPIPFNPSAIAVDAAGDLFVQEAPIFSAVTGPATNAVQVLKISASGATTTIAQASGVMAVNAAGGLYLVQANTVQVIGPGTTSTSYPIAGTVAGLAAAVNSSNTIYVAQQYLVAQLQANGGQPVNSPVTVSAVVDAASESAGPISPGKIVVVYGLGLGPAQGVSNQPGSEVFSTSVTEAFSTSLSGASLTFNGTAAPILYASATQITAVVPYEVTGATAQVVATYQAQISSAFSVPVAAAAPSLFTRNQTGAGQAAAVNDLDGTLNTAANPVKIGGYISLFATGEGQTTPAGVDGQLGGTTPTHPNGNVTVTVGGLPATVQYEGGISGEVAGIMQMNVLVPGGVAPGGYVPVVLQSGTATSNQGTWIAVAGN